MAKIRNHPKRSKICVFCEYWTGDAGLVFINSTVGYEYEHYTTGKCAKRNINTQTFTSCSNFVPNAAARKIL